MKTPLTGLSFEDFRAIVGEWKEKPFRARQVFSWIYKKGARDIEKMSDVPLEFRQRLAQRFTLEALALSEVFSSRDGTKKFLFKLNDANLVEAVSIPAPGRVTGCVSSQAGCKFACSFCASGMAGFRRNLETSEIVDEVLYLKFKAGAGLTHVVFMGTGEPLDNYDNVLKAVRIINSPDALGIGARRITISTCGIVPGIQRLAKEGLQIELSVSLHASNDTLRSQLMPVNKRYPLRELMQACREYARTTGRQVTFEYVMIKNCNSDLQNARELATILRGMMCKVNLIPVNPVITGCEPPGKVEALMFRQKLLDQKVTATIRVPRGQDIKAACGQLRLRKEIKKQ